MANKVNALPAPGDKVYEQAKAAVATVLRPTNPVIDWENTVVYLSTTARMENAFGEQDISPPPTFAAEERAKHDKYKQDKSIFHGGYCPYPTPDGKKHVIMIGQSKMARLNRIMWGTIGDKPVDPSQMGMYFDGIEQIMPKRVIRVSNVKGHDGEFDIPFHKVSHAFCDSVILHSEARAEARDALADVKCNFWEKALRLHPMGILQGCWDSRTNGLQVKFPRCYTSWVEAIDITLVDDAGQYKPALEDKITKLVYGVTQDNAEGAKIDKAQREALSKEGVTHHPINPHNIGIKSKDIRYFAKLNVAAIREKSCSEPALVPLMHAYLVAIGMITLCTPQTTNVRGNMNLKLAKGEKLRVIMQCNDGSETEVPFNRLGMLGYAKTLAKELGIDSTEKVYNFLPDLAAAEINAAAKSIREKDKPKGKNGGGEAGGEDSNGEDSNGEDSNGEDIAEGQAKKTRGRGAKKK